MRRAGIVGVACVIGLLLIPRSGYAENADVATAMKRVIAECEELSAGERQRILCAIVDEVLLPLPDVGEDKRSHAATHLDVFLPDLVRNTSSYTAEQFSVIAESFRWRLKNYAAMSPISDAERKESLRALSSYEGVLEEFIDDKYLDTPVEVREQLRQRLRSSQDEFAAKIGNYFFPQYVGVAQHPISPEEFAAKLEGHVGLANSGTKFAGVRTILDDGRLAQASRDSHVRFFIDREAQALISAYSSGTVWLFRGNTQGLPAPPPELVEARRALVAELARKGREESAAFLQRVEHETLMSDVLNGTGYSIVGGVVEPSDELIRGLEPGALMGREDSHTVVPLTTPAGPAASEAVAAIVERDSGSGYWDRHLPLLALGLVLTAVLVVATIALRRRRNGSLPDSKGGMEGKG